MDFPHLLHQKVRNNSLPFGGIQVILGGDFCQLKPMQSLLDPGDPIYKSVLFGTVFPHRIVLEKIMRQSEFEGDFKKALDSLRMGVCDVDTEAYLRGLSRRCVDIGDNVPPPIHIFFKKLPVEGHNSYMLSCLSGEMLKYESIDTGRTGLLKNTVPKVLMLKCGCKVMLLFNISKSLTNGTLGTFIDAGQTDSKNESLLIKFPNVGVVSIPRKTWYAYRKDGQVQASRTQFPLSLSYAITVHKAPCTKHRALRWKVLSSIAARSLTLVKRINKVLESTNCELDREEDPSLINDENSIQVDEDLLNHEELILKYFASNQGVKQNFNQILQRMTNAEEDQEPQYRPLTQPPDDFVVKNFLETLTKDENVDTLSQSTKEAAQYGIANLEIFELLTRVLWCRVIHLFEGYLSENAKEVHMSAANFTQVTRKLTLNELFLTNEYRSDIMTAFNLRNWSELTCGQ
ncbi:Hypothetical predicted protein [Paramuricea clavata]|uniref:DNA helicase Pif1-like 2B domain-containing protein n=1 Tax=Paramuricea clavata TaxID=317549 RepID=A0A6S7H400_PARCT|nr:Hypothetical predicted protein [Paramuricea clavata]